MGFVTAAVIAGAAVAGAGVLQAQKEKKTAASNRKAIQDANELAYQQFLESRGAGGSAILPLYAPPGTEAELLNRALEFNRLATADPAARVAEYERIRQGLAPTVSAGDKLIQDIYSGELEKRRLAQIDPVLAARTGVADARASAINAALAQTRGRIAAEEARKGYTGAGGVVQNRLLQNTIAARQQAATEQAAAGLQNALDRARVQEAGTQLQLSSLNLPITRANALIAAKQAPLAGVAQNFAIGQAPLNFFRLPVGNPPQPRPALMEQTSDPYAAGLAALGQLAGAYGTYQANQQLIGQMNQPGVGYGAGAGTYGTTLNPNITGQASVAYDIPPPLIPGGY